MAPNTEKTNVDREYTVVLEDYEDTTGDYINPQERSGYYYERGRRTFKGPHAKADALDWAWWEAFHDHCMWARVYYKGEQIACYTYASTHYYDEDYDDE